MNDTPARGRGWRLALAGAAAAAGLIVANADARPIGFVPAQLADAVSVLALDTMQPLASIAVPGKPAGVAVAANGHVYVTSPEAGTVTVIEAARRRVVGRLVLGGGPLGIVAAPDGRQLYVADWYRHQVHLIDLSSPAKPVVADTIAVGQSPSGLAISPDGRRLLSADRDSDQVSIIDVAERRVRARVAVGSRPFGLTLAADGRRAYTANVGSNDVSVIDLATTRVIGTVPVGERPYAIALAAGRAFVTNQYAATVTVFEPATLTVRATLPVDDYPEGIAASADGRSVWVVCWDGNRIQRIDTQTLRVTAAVATDDGPRGFGTFVWDAPPRSP